MPLGSEMAQGHGSITWTLGEMPLTSTCSVLCQVLVRFRKAKGRKGGVGPYKWKKKKNNLSLPRTCLPIFINIIIA